MSGFVFDITLFFFFFFFFFFLMRKMLQSLFVCLKKIKTFNAFHILFVFLSIFFVDHTHKKY